MKILLTLLSPLIIYASSNDFSGLYENEDTMIYIKNENIKTKQINKTNFIKINIDNKISTFKYKLKNTQLILYRIEPDKSVFDIEFIYKLCKNINFEYSFLCKNAQYYFIDENEKALNDYLYRYADSFTKVDKTLFKKDLSLEIPENLNNTEDTSFSLVYKSTNKNEPDFDTAKKSLWFLSYTNTNVNIFINGLDFRDGTPSNERRHIKHKEEWKAYYKSNLFRDNFNIVYSWDSSLGISKNNTKQLESLIKFILKNNTKNSITLIAHSHGGNLSKEVLVNLFEENINLKNISLITLATPHKGVENIDDTLKYIMPVAEIMYDMFSLDFDKHKQMIQASKRLYSGAYNQLEAYKDNAYLQNLNKKFIIYDLHKNTLFIAAKHDEILKTDSSLWKDISNTKKIINNKHGNIVDKPDIKIFEIIFEFKNRK